MQDRDEFLAILRALMSKNPIGEQQRSFSEKNLGLVTKFFGPEGDRKLTFKQFAGFLEGLKDDVIKAEFCNEAKGAKTISERGFASLIVSHARTKSIET